MAVRLFSKDPMSWGQIFFLWLGGLLVVGVTVFAGTGVAYLSDAAQGWRPKRTVWQRGFRSPSSSGSRGGLLN